MTAPTSTAEPPAPTHGCLRCGRPVEIHVALCEDCNPLGLKQPAATQVHAIAAGGIVFFVLVLALLAGAGLSGVGPFGGNVSNVERNPGGQPGLVVTLSVWNGGTKGAATTCRVVEAGHPAGGRGQVVQTPIVPAGETIQFRAQVAVFGDQPLALEAECQSP